jgi:ABC-type antimicrobial peptide transport system permease subunit
VGVFDAGKSAFNSEIWGPGTLVTSDLGRGSTRSVILVRAQDEVTRQALVNRMAGDQRLLLEGKTERKYYEDQMSSAAPVQTLGIFISAIMAIGSSFAAMNTMYTAVARRAREVGILRVLGFSRGSILVSFLLESLLLSLLGGLLGLLLVLPLNGLEGRIGNFVTFSETTFEFEVTPVIAGLGLTFAAVMGVLGGILPARLAARQNILTSLREL